MQDVLLTFVLVAILLSIPATGAVTPLVITQPSENETHFAEMRDFYVYGVFSPVASAPGDFSVELYPESACVGDICSGTPTRSIRSYVDQDTFVTNASQIDWSFVDGSTVKGGYVPDIIKTDIGGGGLKDPNNKVVVTSTYYGALIQGGVTQDYNTTYKDSVGNKLLNITAGDYRIKVTGLSGEFAARCVTKSISFGITDTALGTNRPASNKNVRVSYAIEHGLRTYFDSFPGYFSDGGSNWSNFKKLSAPNNGIEIVNDLFGTSKDVVVVSNNTLFLYNINSASTTYSVELAPILKYGLADGENTTFLYYSNGEPTLTYTDSSGSSQAVTSSLKQFTGSNRLALTRVEVRNATSSGYENLYDPNDTVSKSVYTDLSGTVSMTPGQYFTVYGVTKPIASTVQATATPYWYTIDNRTSSILCTITDTHGNTVSTSTHEVNLSRYYNNYPGSSNPTQKFNSLFEFGADTTTLNAPGTYRITLAGKDMAGSAVSGATASFTLNVNAVSPVEPSSGNTGSGSSGDAPGSPSSAPQVGISQGALAGQPVAFSFTSAVPGKTAVQSVSLTPARTIGPVECILLSVTPGAALLLNDRAVAGYHRITMNWISPDAIDHADIAFSVDKAWLDTHQILPSQVVMLHHTGNQWVELPTRLDQSRDTAYGYIATTTSFSYFAIAETKNRSVVSQGTQAPMGSTTVLSTPSGNAGPAPSPVRPTGTAVPATVAPAVSPVYSFWEVFFPPGGIIPLMTIIAWVIVLVLLIGVVWIIHRWWIRRQNPALFRGFS